MSTKTDNHAKTGGSFLIERHSPEDISSPEFFDKELRMVAKTTQSFVEKEIEPVFDKLEALDYNLSKEVLAVAGDQGLLGVDIPERLGGVEFSKTASMIVTENMANSGSFSVTFNVQTGIGTLPIVYFGNRSQQYRYLPDLANGKIVSAYALTEPGAGSDSLNSKTTAVLNEEGSHYILNGSKMWISNAGFADVFIVFAKIDGEKFTAFLVDRGTKGLSFGKEEKKMGIKGSSTKLVILEDVAVPKELVLGEIGRGHIIAFQTLNIGRLKLAAGSVGGAKSMIAAAANYAQEREQFGMPIAKFGLIKEKIGKMAADTFALESAVYRMTGELDKRLEDTESQEEQLAAIDEYLIEYSFIKFIGSEILDNIIDETLQIHGGNGFSAEYPIELYYRNSRINRIFEGTNEINRLLTSGQLLKRAMKGRIDLMGPAQAAMTGEPISDIDAPEELKKAIIANENLKKAILLTAGAAAMGFMQSVEREQEVMAKVADMIAAVYLSESAILRAQKLIGEPKADKAIRLAKIFTFDAIDRSRVFGTEALRRIPNGTAMLAKFNAYLTEHGTDLIELRREAAKDVYENNAYVFLV
ncbi:MAG TPA: acyl-CoA dehydrogenase [Trueperaceae bacterium]|nr:acyl-CoA dehydrogenase [Trueperaceae bacterium]